MFLNEAAFDPKKAREHGCSAMLLFRFKNSKPFSVHCSKYLVKFVQLVVRNPGPFVMDEVVEAAFSHQTAVHGGGDRDPIERLYLKKIHSVRKRWFCPLKNEPQQSCLGSMKNCF
ncbi:MAG: hypothetical protein CMN32_12210 [Saprospirales bacterium]|nr:hypothetical protein [Saprospirales bacterium]